LRRRDELARPTAARYASQYSSLHKWVEERDGLFAGWRRAAPLSAAGLVIGRGAGVLGDMVPLHRLHLTFFAALAAADPRDGVLDRLLGQPFLFERGTGLRDQEVPLVGRRGRLDQNCPPQATPFQRQW
jgi:hypothetical protein